MKPDADSIALIAAARKTILWPSPLAEAVLLTVLHSVNGDSTTWPGHLLAPVADAMANAVRSGIPDTFSEERRLRFDFASALILLASRGIGHPGTFLSAMLSDAEAEALGAAIHAERGRLETLRAIRALPEKSNDPNS